MMKTKLFLALAASLMVASCAQKESPEVLPEVVDHDQTRYLSVSLSSPKAETKAFDDGLDAESTVKNLYFVFYDKDGKALDYAYFSDKDFENNLDNQFTPDEETPGTSNVTKFWKSVVPVNLKQGDNVPAYVMCFINPIKTEGLTELSLAAVSQQKRSSVRDTGEGYFPMSNSVYYGTDPITGVHGRMRATPIVSTKLFDTEKKALEASAGEILDIYVERYAAKLSVGMAATAVSEITFDGHELKFVPEFWRPNAIDTETFITKMFGTSGTADGAFDFSKTPTTAEMEAAFNNYNTSTEAWKAWNDSGNFRSYWACSPSYFKNDYPYVSDDVDDLENREGEDPSKHAYALKYFSYNEIKTDGIAYANGFNSENVFYSRETTASIEAIRNTATGNPAATVSSIVVVGKYHVDNEENTHTFYIDKANGDYYADEADVRMILAGRQRVVYEDPQGSKPAPADWFVVEHPKKAVRGETKVAGRYVTIQLATAQGYVYDMTADNGKGAYVPLTSAKLAEVNKQIWSQANTVEMFKDGLAFFYVPVRHLGFNATRETHPNMVDGKYVWENSEIGDYGIVRNHAYNVTINSIKGLGTGLRDENQPIVPPKDEVNYYIAARLNILAWNVVPQWSVDL